jgi:hypothetical protein
MQQQPYGAVLAVIFVSMSYTTITSVKLRPRLFPGLNASLHLNLDKWKAYEVTKIYSPILQIINPEQWKRIICINPE